VLTTNALLSAATIAACATFTLAMPFAAMIAILAVGGFFRSLQFTAVNALAYAEVPPERMSRATSLASVGQQVSLSTASGSARSGRDDDVVARRNNDHRAGLPGRVRRGRLIAAISR